MNFISSNNLKPILRSTTFAECDKPDAFWGHTLAAFTTLTRENIDFEVVKVVINGNVTGQIRIMKSVAADFDKMVRKIERRYRIEMREAANGLQKDMLVEVSLP